MANNQTQHNGRKISPELARLLVAMHLADSTARSGQPIRRPRPWWLMPSIVTALVLALYAGAIFLDA